MINHRISKAENFTAGGAPRRDSHHNFDRRVTRSALKAAGLQAISGLDSRGNPPSDALFALRGARPSQKPDVRPSKANRLPALVPVNEATANSDTISPLVDTPDLDHFNVVLQQVRNMHRSEQGSAVTASVVKHPKKLVLRVPQHPNNGTPHDKERHNMVRSLRFTKGRATPSGALEPQLLPKRRRSIQSPRSGRGSPPVRASVSRLKPMFERAPPLEMTYSPSVSSIGSSEEEGIDTE